MIFEVMLRCRRCDSEWHGDSVDTKPRLKAQEANLKIIAGNHYAQSGHHTFVLETVESRELDVAAVRDPNQLRISDDPENAHLDPSNWGMKPS